MAKETFEADGNFIFLNVVCIYVKNDQTVFSVCDLFTSITPQCDSKARTH